MKVDDLLPLNNFEGGVMILDKPNIRYCRLKPADEDFILVHTYNINDSNLKRLIYSINNLKTNYSNEKNYCYAISNKKIYKVGIKTSDVIEYDYKLIYENTSDDYIFSTGILNYDNTLYMFSYSSTQQKGRIQQFAKISKDGDLGLITSKTYDSAYDFHCCIIENNPLFEGIYGIYKGTGNSQYLGKVKLNNQSVISNNQTSLNGKICIDKTKENLYGETQPLFINDVLTLGSFLELMKNFTCSNNNPMNMNYLYEQTFINSNMFISQSN